MNKTQAQRWHAKWRAKERYGVHVNKATYKELVTNIQAHKGAKFVVRLSGRLTIWGVDYQDKHLWLVYDGSRHNIVTFLPPDLTEDLIKEQAAAGGYREYQLALAKKEQAHE